MKKAIIFDLNGVLGGSVGLFSVTQFGLMLEKIHKMGVKLFILSNGSGSMLKTNSNHTRLVRKFFTKEYYSNNTGHLKPDIDAWNEVFVDNELSANDCLFVDDDISNIEVAKKLGCEVILHSKNEVTIKKIGDMFGM